MLVLCCVMQRGGVRDALGHARGDGEAGRHGAERAPHPPRGGPPLLAPPLALLLLAQPQPQPREAPLQVRVSFRGNVILGCLRVLCYIRDTGRSWKNRTGFFLQNI